MTNEGELTGRSAADVVFQLVEFSTSRRVAAKIVIEESTISAYTQYDFILGANIMYNLGISIKTSNDTLTWDDITINMHACKTLSGQAYIANYEFSKIDIKSTV